MGAYHKEVWVSEGRGQSRRQRASGAYRYYVPTKLADLDISLDADVAGDVSRAEAALLKLNSSPLFARSTEGIARLLLRAEAVSSSHIEGLSIGTRRLLRAEMQSSSEPAVRADAAAVEIIGNIHAMEHAIAQAEDANVVTVGTIEEIHRTLCKNSKIESFGGATREMQNWVGGSSYNPLSADFIPPAPQYVTPLLEDLADFCNKDLFSPVAQAALVHAQFETIHPFVDGNGRCGRALIHLILGRRGIASRFVAPISLVMATHSRDYVDALTSFRFDDEAGTAREGVNDWVSFFAGCCLQACKDAEQFEASSIALLGEWEQALGNVRKNSATEAVLNEVLGMPLFTASSMAQATGRSFSSVSKAIQRCVDAGIIKQTKGGSRNRVFEAPHVINEFNIFERQLASPAGDTRAEPPTRPVPQKL